MHFTSFIIKTKTKKGFKVITTSELNDRLCLVLKKLGAEGRRDGAKSPGTEAQGFKTRAEEHKHLKATSLKSHFGMVVLL